MTAIRSAVKIVAIAEAFRQAQTVGGRRVIHCLGLFTGADWDLAGVVREITHARTVHWHSWLLHDLDVLGQDGFRWRFEITHPFDPECECDRCLDIWSMQAEAGVRP